SAFARQGPLRAGACRLSGKDGLAWTPACCCRRYLRRTYDCAKWTSVQHQAQTHRNHPRGPCGKALYPTAQKSFPAFLVVLRRVDERTRCPARVTRVRSLRQCRGFSAPVAASGIALLAPRAPTADLSAWPDHSRPWQPNAWMRGRPSREATWIV